MIFSFNMNKTLVGIKYKLLLSSYLISDEANLIAVDTTVSVPNAITVTSVIPSVINLAYNVDIVPPVEAGVIVITLLVL